MFLNSTCVACSSGSISPGVRRVALSHKKIFLWVHFNGQNLGVHVGDVLAFIDTNVGFCEGKVIGI